MGGELEAEVEDERDREGPGHGYGFCPRLLFQEQVQEYFCSVFGPQHFNHISQALTLVLCSVPLMFVFCFFFFFFFFSDSDSALPCPLPALSDAYLHLLLLLLYHVNPKKSHRPCSSQKTHRRNPFLFFSCRALCSSITVHFHIFRAENASVVVVRKTLIKFFSLVRVGYEPSLSVRKKALIFSFFLSLSLSLSLCVEGGRKEPDLFKAKPSQYKRWNET